MRRALWWIAIVGLVLVAPIAAVPSYEFPPPQPFVGPSWHNPYSRWDGPYRKVNLHAHSVAWGGLTAGEASPEEMAARYAEAGFEALALSNYHQVTTLERPPLPMLRAYEHGINLTKAHRLVLGSSDTVALDFPVSTRSMRQWMLNVLGSRAALVGLNHPSLRGGHGCADVAALTGFQLFEVHNPYATSHLEWDCALSAGRLAWVVGNDDAHTARDESIGIAWNMVGTRELTEAAIFDALGAGRSYAVRGTNGRMDVELRELTEDQPGLFRIQLSGKARIEWWMDGTLREAHDDTDGSWIQVPGDAGHYVRVVVRTPNTELVFNPIIRQGAWSAPVATIDWFVTGGSWLSWCVAASVLAWAGRRKAPRLRLVASDRRAA